MVHGVDGPPDADKPVSLGHRLARSQRFKALFGEGMRLVEEASSYLDGAGRKEAQQLPPRIASVYAAESMRLTTRLMQIASWLLIRRAVIEGEISTSTAQQDRVKVRVSPQNRVASPAMFRELPPALQDLTDRSLRMQSRVLHIDRMVNDHDERPPAANPGLEGQLARLREVYRVTP